MSTGTVQRFDARRGYGFIRPDGAVEDADGKTQDVFVHQNDIVMEGFRSLHLNERVSYDEEVGEKGVKAVNVNLLSPRAPSDHRPSRPPSSGVVRPRSGGRVNSGDPRVDKLLQLLIDTQVLEHHEVVDAGLA